MSCDISVSGTKSRVPISVRALSLDELLSAPRVGNDTYQSSQTSFGWCSRAMVGYLLRTWRPREFGNSTEGSVREIPMLHVVLVLSPLPVLRAGRAAASHFLKTISPPLLPISFLPPHDENIVWFFPHGWGSQGKLGTVVFCTNSALMAIHSFQGIILDLFTTKHPTITTR